MKLYYDKRLSDPTYYVQVGIRNGKKVSSKNIDKIGKHSELLKTHKDPLQYAKEYVENLNKNKDISKISIIADLNQKLDDSDNIITNSLTLNIGYLILNQIYNKLDINKFFNNISSNYKTTYDVALINRILSIDRILNPRSKLQTVSNLNFYYEKPKFDYQHVLRFMDILADNFNDYIAYLYKASNKVIKRNTSVCYYDCTNYYFEIEKADDDYIDEYTGELIEGFRKYGVSKEHRPNPIVQMGLFMDSDGIPMSMCLSRGNQNEQLTALPLESELVKMIETNDFIYCSDAGLGSYNIRKFNSMGGRRFIITQSLKRLPDTLIESVFNDYDYKLLSNNKNIKIETLKSFNPKNNINLYEDKAYKEIDASKKLVMEFKEEKQLKNGKTKMVKSKATLNQKIIVTFSRKVMEYQRYIRNGQIERAKKYLKNNNFENFQHNQNDFRRFIKKDSKVKDAYYLDEDKIKEEEKYDGYYLLVTNVYDKDVKEILRISSNRYKIEECFRIIKTDFSGRPIYHHLEKRIIAHFMICYTSLLIYRLLEIKLNQNNTHLTTKQIINTLKNMNVIDLDGLIYKSTYNNSYSLKSLLGVYPINLDHKYYMKQTLDKLIK